MREITSHKVNGVNDAIKIEVLDEPGAGGACHQYRVTYGVRPDGTGENYYAGDQLVEFQKGPVAEAGHNGTTHEALLAIVIDRLESFQKGPYSCRENAIALTKIQEAMHWLQHRTNARMARGVEGTHAV